jgi:predicted phage baseplate assembly protein
MTSTLDPTVRHLSDCGCCSGLGPVTPAIIDNRPGLSAIAYRSGTWHEFKRSMLADLSGQGHQALAGLATRADDDLTIALLDAVAVVADVLTFYGERIANESYLRTATERLSILELARLIGYEPRPGVAASAIVAFEIEEAKEPTAPAPTATIDVGVKVQSVPGQDEKPQTFETVEKIEASAEWNAMAARTVRAQVVSLATTELWVDGTATDLRAGDVILLVDPERTRRASAGTQASSVGPQSVASANAGARTQGGMIAAQQVAAVPAAGHASTFEKTAMAIGYGLPFDARRVTRVVVDFDARRTRVVLGASLGPSVAFRDQTANLEVYALRTSASPFGANAADWSAMSDEFTSTHGGGGNWPGFDQVFNEDHGVVRTLDLDAVHDSISSWSWLVLTTQDDMELFWVRATRTTGRAQFGLSGKLTQLTLAGSGFATFWGERRHTTAFAQAERLVLADRPIDPPLTEKTNAITLARTITPPPKGRTVILTGEDESGERVTESALLESVTTVEGASQLVFTGILAHRFRLSTLRINANVARSTHGETVEEVLGAGDASRPYQHFVLKQGPLTFVRDPLEPSGARPALSVRVDGLEWRETADFYERTSKERVFATHTDDGGRTSIEFGDGIRGSRLPSGQENVRATYRKGTGVGGNVGAGRLTTLLSRPLNLKAATNPLPATGGDDPEARDDARQNAPLVVLTLDRVVSLRDYEDFARAYGGVAKALATWSWDGQRRGVFVTIAGPDGVEVAPDDIALLAGAVRAAGDPFVPLRIASYRKATFRTTFNLGVEPAYRRTTVSADVVAAVRATFGFKARAFGQSVALSEIIATIQAVPGVSAADVDTLQRVGIGAGIGSPPPILTAALPEVGVLGTALPAELLLLSDDPIVPGDMT